MISLLPYGLLIWFLLPRHGDAKGVLRVNQVIHALGIVGNRELYAHYLAVEGVTRGALVWGDRRTAVLADIAAVVGGEDV